MKKILLIGCGHMGSALLKSWSKNKLLNISVVDPITHKKIKKIDKKILTFKSLLKVKRINQFDVIIFAVKPQIIKQVVSEFSFRCCFRICGRCSFSTYFQILFVVFFLILNFWQ